MSTVEEAIARAYKKEDQDELAHAVELTNSDSDEGNGVFLGGEELWDRLDVLAKATLGIGAAEFADGFQAGRFSRVPAAAGLAALLPFVTRPRPRR